MFTHSLHLEKLSLELQEREDLTHLKTQSFPNLCKDRFSIAMVMFIYSLLSMYKSLACYNMFFSLYHVRDGYCGFLLALFHVFFSLFFGKFVKGVLPLIIHR